mgnify:CR=1 FL=1
MPTRFAAHCCRRAIVLDRGMARGAAGLPRGRRDRPGGRGCGPPIRSRVPTICHGSGSARSRRWQRRPRPARSGTSAAPCMSAAPAVRCARRARVCPAARGRSRGKSHIRASSSSSRIGAVRAGPIAGASSAGLNAFRRAGERSRPPFMPLSSGDPKCFASLFSAPPAPSLPLHRLRPCHPRNQRSGSRRTLQGSAARPAWLRGHCRRSRCACASPME